MQENSIIERKCLNCGTWNKNEDFCTQCNAPISPKEIDRVAENEKRIEEANKPKDKFEILAEKLKNHQNFFLRLIYKIAYSIGMIFAGIGAFLAWMVAMANG